VGGSDKRRELSRWEEVTSGVSLQHVDASTMAELSRVQHCMISEWCGRPCGCNETGVVDSAKANKPKLYPANLVCKQCLTACGDRDGKASDFFVMGESVLPVDDETTRNSSKKKQSSYRTGWANYDKQTISPPFLPLYWFNKADVPSKELFNKKLPKTALIKHPDPGAARTSGKKTCVHACGEQNPGFSVSHSS